MNLTDALKKTERFNEKGVGTCISFLPIAKTDPKLIKKEVEEYFKVLSIIHKKHLNSEVTVKVHQFGALENPQRAAKAIGDIVKKAHELKCFVWIDMERPATVDFTIEVFEKLYDKFGNVGICLQAYLKRTESDLSRVLKRRAPVRLVKGFYKWQDVKPWSKVTENFSRLIEPLIKGSSRPCIATHDAKLILKAKKIMLKTGKGEFQFFHGVRDTLAESLAKEGFKTRIYLPYGNLIRYIFHGFPTFDNLRNIERLLHVKNIF